MPEAEDVHIHTVGEEPRHLRLFGPPKASTPLIPAKAKPTVDPKPSKEYSPEHNTAEQ
mgnify:CR=1 FL=1